MSNVCKMPAIKAHLHLQFFPHIHKTPEFLRHNLKVLFLGIIISKDIYIYDALILLESTIYYEGFLISHVNIRQMETGRQM
jgi:hypothetical protein